MVGEWMGNFADIHLGKSLFESVFKVELDLYTYTGPLLLILFQCSYRFVWSRVSVQSVN